MAEVELKLLVPPAQHARLQSRLRAFGVPRVQMVDSVYFDTAARALARAGLALRLRRQARPWLQTLNNVCRSPAIASRDEWEVPVAAGRLQFAALPAAARAQLRAAGVASARPLRPVYRTRFRRSAWTVERDAATVELALDVGQIVAGAQREPILELELELKAGPAAALPALARAIMAPPRGAVLPLLPLGASKAARGQRLADQLPLRAAKASGARLGEGLRPKLPAGAALRCVLANGLEVLLANAHGLRRRDEPEFVHQARVALRRMRSALRLLARDTTVPAALISELRWLASALGPARDADVLVTSTLPAVLAALTAPPSAAQSAAASAAWSAPPSAPPSAEKAGAVRSLLAAARRPRVRGRRLARAAVGSGRCALLALDLLAWTRSPHDERERTLRQLAPRRLASAHRRLLRAGRFFAALPPAEQHAVRILGKRLRYALDLFAPALPAPAAAAAANYGAVLAQLQEELGALNDAAVAAATLPELSGDAALLASARTALAGGRLQQLERVVAVEAGLRALAQTRPPWKAA
ncbi:MAG: CHAD domain-containing protein [Betaproteobacteria bacterium]